MTLVRWTLVAALILSSLGARRGRAQDSTPNDPVRAERLRRVIEERFANRLSQELGLRGEQETKTRAILATWSAKRRTVEREDRRLRQALSAEMRPGIAANPDSVNRIVDALMASRLDYVQTFRDELKELSTVLTPVQRGQYVLLRERLMQRVQEIRQQRQLNGAGLRPRMNPMRRQ